MTAKSPQDSAKKSAQSRRPRSVTEILGEVLEPVLARKTGMKLDLIRSWAELAGEAYSSTTRPERIDWPKRKNEDEPFEPGVLVVACEPSAAIFFQHEQAQIIERVNLFFGFLAIKRIKILQKPVLKLENSHQDSSDKPISKEDQVKLSKLLNEIDDPETRERLQKLGSEIYRKNSL